MKILEKIFKPITDTFERLFHEMNENMFHSSREWGGLRASIVSEGTSTGTTGYISISEAKKNDKPDTRIEKKPIEVMNELFEDELVIDCNDLDKKIESLKKRAKIINYDKEDIDKAIFWLANRKKFDLYKNTIKWKITTKDKIEALCKKYKLQFSGLASFRRSLPEEAVDEMERYNNLFSKFSKDKKPVYSIIADDSAFEKNIEKKRDPILLAESPFGNYQYVLGAWDKEVKIMHELWRDDRW